MQDDVINAVSYLKENSNTIREICSRYGLYGGVFYYKPSLFEDSDLNKFYIIAGTDPRLCGSQLPESIDPEEIIRRDAGNKGIFYPDYWAIELASDNSNLFSVTQSLMEFCKGAEAVQVLYREYDTPVPKKLRLNELNMLISIYDKIHDPYVSETIKAQYQKDLKRFFQKEKTQGTQEKKWLDYYRSERFPSDGGIVSKSLGFLKRNQQIVELNTLMRMNGNIQKLEMQEHEYQIFEAFMKGCYPYVSYAIDEIAIVDHKLRNSPNDPPGTPRYISSEEFDAIKQQQFAKRSFEAFQDLQVTQWKFRNVYYKEADETIVAAVINDIRTRYAKCNLLNDIKKGGGDLAHIAVPQDNFANFVSLAKANNLKFYIDNRGSYYKPNFSEYHIIYNRHQEAIVQQIRNRMLYEKVEQSHAVSVRVEQALPLHHRIDYANGQRPAVLTDGKEKHGLHSPEL